MAKRLDSSTRARRLLVLLPLLHRGDRIPISDLAAAVGCTPQETAADLTTLTLCGIPPFSPADLVDLEIDGDMVTVYMDPPGLDRPLRLTMAEARAIGAALEAAGYASDSPLRTKLAEISAATVSAEDLERTVRTGTAEGGLADTYSTLAAAADAHEKLRIAYYTGSTGTVSERVVEPWALVQRIGAWYLVGMCEMAGQERVFRLDRIRAIEHTGQTFAPPEQIPTNVTPGAEGAPVARIRITAGSDIPDTRAWPGSSTEPQADGSTIVAVPYRSLAWLARRVVAYLGRAEVLEPSELRAAVRDLAGRTVQRIM